MVDNKDKIYLQGESHGSFVFDSKVAAVFPDMIKRSVPGYATIISMIGVLAEQYAQDNSVCYDLGCSLGAASLLMRHQIKRQACHIVAVDNSEAMMVRCQEIMDADSVAAREQGSEPLSVELICDDLLNLEFEPASVVVLNFTLQFIAPELRSQLMERIHAAMLPGGVLVLSEKICFADPSMNQLYIDMYHRFKQANGYSELEISRKRAALENVLVPETLKQHQTRLHAAGFSDFGVWFQCFNFASMLAFKR